MNSIYLNNAATGWPKAPGVGEAILSSMETPPFHPGRASSDHDNVILQCRKRIARFLGVDDSSRIVLTAHATHALNLAIGGLGLNDRSHVVTTVAEHNSVFRPLHHIQQRHPGLRISVVDMDSNGVWDEDAYTQYLENDPTLVIINHASNVTGRVHDVQRYFAQAKRAGAATLLDAAQSFGCISISANRIQADLIAFTGHKGLHGPAGTGGLYVHPALELNQIYVGGTGVRSDLMLHPPDMPMRLEAGTPNMQGLSGMAAALQWVEDKGFEFSLKANQLARRLRDGLREISKVLLFDAGDRVERTPVVSLQIQGWDVEELGFVLAESFGIVCRSGLHCAPLIHKSLGCAPQGTVRLSPSGFNTEEEIGYTLDAIGKLAA